MKGKIKIALIDGLPYCIPKGVKVFYLPEISYPWDSELFGVPEFRNHGKKMLKIIADENPKADVILYPFYPKFKSVFKNYQLLAISIFHAVNAGCQIISMALEVLGAKYLSAEMLKAYRYAYENKVIICVSAGNNNPLNNPLIHKKYTLPIIGLTKKGKIPEKYINNDSNLKFCYGIYGGDINFNSLENERVSCSIATARFSSNAFLYLSKKENYFISI